MLYRVRARYQHTLPPSSAESRQDDTYECYMNVEDEAEVGEHQVGGARVWGCERASRVGIDGGGLGGGVVL